MCALAQASGALTSSAFFGHIPLRSRFHFPNNLVVRLIQEIILIVISRITAEAICSAESQHSARFL